MPRLRSERTCVNQQHQPSSRRPQSGAATTPGTTPTRAPRVTAEELRQPSPVTPIETTGRPQNEAPEATQNPAPPTPATNH